jgi:hypothetical protein
MNCKRGHLLLISLLSRQRVVRSRFLKIGIIKQENNAGQITYSKSKMKWILFKLIGNLLLLNFQNRIRLKTKIRVIFGSLLNDKFQVLKETPQWIALVNFHQSERKPKICLSLQKKSRKIPKSQTWSILKNNLHRGQSLDILTNLSMTTPDHLNVVPKHR